MSAAGAPRLPSAQPQRQEQPTKLLGLGLAVLVSTLIPYLCGYLLSPPGQSFLGALNNIGDLTQYLAAIRQGAGGPGATPINSPPIGHAPWSCTPPISWLGTYR